MNSVTECRLIVLFGAEGVVTAAALQTCTGRLPSCQSARRDCTVVENVRGAAVCQPSTPPQLPPASLSPPRRQQVHSGSTGWEAIRRHIAAAHTQTVRNSCPTVQQSASVQSITAGCFPSSLTCQLTDHYDSLLPSIECLSEMRRREGRPCTARAVCIQFACNQATCVTA